MAFPQKNQIEPSLDKYLQEISTIPLLSPDDEISYAKRIRAGDHTALDKLTRANLRFVVSIAKQYQNQGLSLGDLINAGNLGLLKAATRFDETRGFKFISYAVWWIRQSILQALAEQSRIVRLPLNRIGLLNKIEKLFGELEQVYQREPSTKEIADELKLQPSDINDALYNATSHLSLDAPFSQDEENSLLDMLESNEEPSPETELIKESMMSEIERILSSLSPREAQVVRLYFGIDCEHPLTLEEIGETFNLTRERVRQIKEKAIQRLRHNSRSKILRKYLG
ncbi:RNA polymerase sigma factor RpoD/SigA [candidate division KSB1 bacterium]|nr:RNA polymerase sigma factor RpoD/SigA [candidate division KSB1 bacterium]RQW07155.1 MAG: RNA polymerase sigma factor RpoD/SigA [candidate division KSB1 bacterium]